MADFVKIKTNTNSRFGFEQQWLLHTAGRVDASWQIKQQRSLRGLGPPEGRHVDQVRRRQSQHGDERGSPETERRRWLALRLCSSLWTENPWDSDTGKQRLTPDGLKKIVSNSVSIGLSGRLSRIFFFLHIFSRDYELPLTKDDRSGSRAILNSHASTLLHTENGR